MDHLLHWVLCEEASLMGLFDLAASPHPHHHPASSPPLFFTDVTSKIGQTAAHPHIKILLTSLTCGRVQDRFHVLTLRQPGDN